MKTFQALILLFIYFLFTAGGISRAPLCDQGKNCQRSDKQISFDESTTPPAECHETEAQQSSIIEHRTDHAVKLLIKSAVAPVPNTRQRYPAVINQAVPALAGERVFEATPIYLMNCVHRL